MNAFILTSDRVSKEWSISALKVIKSRECFIEVYIDNQCLIVVVYFNGTFLMEQERTALVAFENPILFFLMGQDKSKYLSL